VESPNETKKIENALTDAFKTLRIYRGDKRISNLERISNEEIRVRVEIKDLVKAIEEIQFIWTIWTCLTNGRSPTSQTRRNTHCYYTEQRKTEISQKRLLT